MQAVVYERYGGPEVLAVKNVPEPASAPGQVRVRVRAAALNPKDVLLRKGKLRWLGAGLPATPGYDVAGELLEDAGDLKAGTAVYGMINAHRAGGCAEVALLPTDGLASMPPSLSMVEAASLPLAALTALQALRDELGAVAGQTVLINGASGGVGTVAVQIARAMGLGVTAVCSGRNRELVTDLGADRVVDYTVESPADQRGFDHVFDVFGNLPYPKAKACLRPGGRYCTTVPTPGSIARGVLRKVGVHRASLVVVKSRRADLEQLNAWVEAGKLRPVVDRVLPLGEAVEAQRYLETRRARGKIVHDLSL